MNSALITKRPATATESNYYVGKLIGGASLLSVRSEILKTSGYFGMHPDSTDLVQSLHVETLSRAAIAKERKNLGKLPAWKVVDKVLGLNEYRQETVDSIYATFALRGPTKKERNVAVAKLKKDNRYDDQLAAQLAAKSALRT